MDAKGRIKLPAALLQQLGADQLQFTVNRGFEKNLMLYPKQVWDKKTKEINQLNIYNTKQRQAIRYFYRGATGLTVDTNGRILIPKTLIDSAGLAKDIMLFAYQEQIEIWSKEEYERFFAKEPEDFAAIAEEAFGSINSNGANNGL